jgi:hypothetical protein
MAGKGRHRLEEPKNHRWVRGIAVVGAGSVLALSVGTGAHADTIVVGPDVTKAPGDSATFQVYLAADDNATDLVNGCNASGTAPVTVAFSSSDTAVATSPSSATVTTCDDPTTTSVVEGAQTVSYSVLGTAANGDTTTITATGSGGKDSFYFTGNPPNQVKVVVPQGSFASDAITITVAAGNSAPTANAGGPYTGAEGSAVSLTGSGSDPDSGDSIASYSWSYTVTTADAGAACSFSPNATSQSPSVTCTDDGAYELSLVVTDSHGQASAASTASLALSNEAPIIDTASNNGPVNEGSAVTISVTSHDPGSNDTLTTEYDCTNNGSWSTTNTCTFSDNGVYTVGVRVTDDDTSRDTDSTSVTVNNVAPDITAVAFSASSGACSDGTTNLATLDVVFADPGADTWDAQIDWDYDGTTFDDAQSYTGVGKSFSKTHGYTTAGSHTAAVKVTDDDAGVDGPEASSGSYVVLLNMGAIQAPFNSDGSSVWKYGSTLPVKVKITDCQNHSVPGLAPRVGASMISSTAPSASIDETASTSSADTTGVMRYDASAGQYIYNFASKVLSDPSAIYYMKVKGTDADGNLVTTPPVVEVRFGLKAK